MSWALIGNESSWTSVLTSFRMPHLLQQWAWGELKARWGWRAQRWRLVSDGITVAAAQVLTRQVGPVCVMYVPKGPVAHDISGYVAALKFLKGLAWRKRALWLKVDGDFISTQPADIDSSKDLGSAYRSLGFAFSSAQVQFRNTGLTQIAARDQDQLGAMHQKWRYNIRLAAKRGVAVRVGGEQDFPALYEMYATTGLRDGFAIREQTYYVDVWRSLGGHALIAEREGQALAAVILFGFVGRAWYFYGMSRTEGREHMPTYALQFEALKWAREQGYEIYDWWGAPDDLADTNDGMAGVWRWKEGFGAVFFAGAGAWDYKPIPLLTKLAGKFAPQG